MDIKNKRWIKEETEYLINNWNVIKIKDMKLDRTYKAITSRAGKLKLNESNIRRYPWDKNDTEYLEDNWGHLSIVTIAKNLNRSESSIQQKARRCGLGPFLGSGEYLTLNELHKAIYKRNIDTYRLDQWVDKGLPIKTKRVKDNSFKIIYLQDWWEWAEMNSTLIDFSKMDPLILGKEPDWLTHQRNADIERNYFKKTPWTKGEDNKLRTFLSTYKFTYRELSLKLKRTEGAIKRRVIDLGIKARPVKMSNHNPWTDEEVEILTGLYHKGHTPNTIANYVNRSAQSCSGKIERMIKEEVLFPRSEFRSSC